MADVFISYAREDRETVGRLAARLEAAGLSCWWDKQLAAGDKYLERTQAELDSSKAVLVVWSKYSVNSHWVADEAGVGRESGRIAPISLDGSAPPLGFRQFQVIDFTPWVRGEQAPFDDLVASLQKLAPGAKAGTGRPESGQLPPKWSRLPLIPTMAALGAVVLALAVWGLSSLAPRKPSLAPSIAVLPFENISGDPAKDYSARGVAMEIIDTLSQLKGMEVISRNSSFSFPADADPVEVGGKLGVAHVLSGTVHEQNGQLAITAELINARTGATIRADRYEADTSSVRRDGIQSLIAENISGAMSIAFDIEARRRLDGTGTKSLEAYDLYIRGLDEWWSKYNTRASVDYFKRAIDIDPNYAEAWGVMAIATASTGWGFADPADARAEQNKAYEFARRAVELDPDLNIAQTMFAAVSTTQLKWIEGDEAFQKALAISRNELGLTNWFYLLHRTGRLGDAEKIREEIERIDPIRGLNAQIIHVYAAQGKSDAVREELVKRGWLESPELQALTNVLVYQVNAGAPRASIRKTLEGLSRRTELGPSELANRLLAVFDDAPKARAALRAAYDDPKLSHSSRWELIPLLAAWYGDNDLVLRAWRDELPLNILRTMYIWDPVFADARAAPEFKILVRDLGMVEYWRAKGWADKCRPLGGEDFVCT